MRKVVEGTKSIWLPSEFVKSGKCRFSCCELSGRGSGISWYGTDAAAAGCADFSGEVADALALPFGADTGTREVAGALAITGVFALGGGISGVRLAASGEVAETVASRVPLETASR